MRRGIGVGDRLPPPTPPPDSGARPTSAASRSAVKASALPLFDAGYSVLPTLKASPLRGTPFSSSSKPFSAIGVPAVQVPTPLDCSALVPRSRSSQL